MLTLTNRQSLDRLSLDRYHVILLVEGFEASVFANPDLWFEGIEVLAVDCGGFPALGALYESLAPSHEQRLLPTVDQDSLDGPKENRAASAWNSPNLHIFSWTFEEAFDDWMLAHVFSTQWSERRWELSEDELSEIRRSARADRKALYEAIDEYGLRKYDSQGFQLPSKPELVQSLGRLMWCNHWLPPRLRPWVKAIYQVGGKNITEPSMPVPSFDVVNWEVARDRELSGFLVACESGKLLGIDFDAQNAGYFEQPSHVQPRAKPMWSPDGEWLLYQGKSVAQSKTVVGLLSKDGRELVANVGGSGYPTSLIDWDPMSPRFFYISGVYASSYRMCRRSLDASRTVPVDPAIHGGVLKKIGRKTVGLASGQNKIFVFELRDTTRLIRQKQLTEWHRQAEPHESEAIAWDNYSDDGSFAIAQPTTKGDGACPTRIFTGKLDPRELTVNSASLAARPLRRIMSLCWSPDSRYLVATSAYERMMLLVDCNSGCLDPIVRGDLRVSGRSWLPKRPTGWTLH